MPTESASFCHFVVLSSPLFFLLITFGRGCDPRDRAALLAFSNGLESPLSLWPGANGSATDCCGWVGVTCSYGTAANRRVVGLYLPNMTLRGPLSSSLGRLLHLRRLELPENHLSGRIPEELYGLRSLEVMDLSINSLHGPLSSKIANLSSLVCFQVASNSLYGTIPNVFHGLKKLQYFSIPGNSFSGQLPASLSSCSDLRCLKTEHNNMSGSIDFDFTNLPKLEVLILAYNYFNGSISDSILSCKKLQVLDLSGNELRAHFSWETLPSSLRCVILHRNHLTNITRALLSLQKLQNLTALILTGNFIKEEMPSSGISGFFSLRFLGIDNSELSGVIPMWLSRSKNLVTLDLSNNYLTGEIPMFLTQLKSLNSSEIQESNVVISVYGQQFTETGEVQPGLYLQNNMLSGKTWMLLSNLRQLVNLDLSNNAFSGTIPDDFSKMKHLQYLDLSSNQISGTIPPSLVQLTYLSHFCVANNRLHGDVPSGFQFSTFPPECFEGNPGLCYFGKLGCHSPTSFVVNPNEQDEEAYTINHMGIPFAIGVAVGWSSTILVGSMYYGWAKIK